MVIPSLLIKGALVVAGAGIVSSATVGTIVTYQKSMLGSSQEEMEGLEKKCYVIPTEDNSQKKLLLCVPTYQYMLQLGEEEKKEILAIEKSSDKLIVSWQGLEGDSSVRRKLTNKSEELEINGNGWESIKEDVNLTVSCHFVPDTAKNDMAKWQCSGSAVKDVDQTTFQLTPFFEEVTTLSEKKN